MKTPIPISVSLRSYTLESLSSKPVAGAHSHFLIRDSNSSLDMAGLIVTPSSSDGSCTVSWTGIFLWVTDGMTVSATR